MLKKILCSATLLCAAGFSNAATVVLMDTVAITPTNFNTVVNFAKFDTMGGTRVLNSVKIQLDGEILGDIEVESRDNEPATITSTLEAVLTLTDENLNQLVVSVPSISEVFNASAYDGTTDFGGTSGMTFTDVSASAMNMTTYVDAMTLAFFTASGMDVDTDITFDATATSAATGSGNLVSSFDTSAGGLITIVYDYSDVTVGVSAPSHVALLGLGLLAFAGLRKVRK